MPTTIEISREEYKELLEQKHFADAMRMLLATKATEQCGLFRDEILMLCKLYGIEVDSE